MKKMGRWIVLLLLAELVLFFWIGLRVQARYEAPVRIIGQLREAPVGSLGRGPVAPDPRRGAQA